MLSRSTHKMHLKVNYAARNLCKSIYMKTFCIKYKFQVPEDFTGICKILINSSISYYKNGCLHREDGPALLWRNGGEDWYYKGACYGYKNDFTNESWKRFIKLMVFK